MSLENKFWGAPHIHGELLRLGFTVAQSTVAKYMAKPRGSRSGQSWSAFLRNHLPHIVAMDLFVVPTITFVQLYVLVIVRLARRQLIWVNVTAHPKADWIAQQITEAFPWDEAPRYLIRDRDAVYVVRIFEEWTTIIGDWSVPKSVSWVALIVAGGLALLGLRLSQRE